MEKTQHNPIIFEKIRATAVLIFFLFYYTVQAQPLEYLQSIEQGINNKGLTNASVMTTDPSGKNVYVGSILKPTLAVYARNTTTGELTYQQLLQNGENGIKLTRISSILVTPNGKQVYVADRGNYSLLVFDRDITTGKLTFKQILEEGTNDIWIVGAGDKLELSGDGKFLYSVGSDGIVYFGRDLTTGTLSESGFYESPFFSPNSIVISPDDAYLYTTNSADSSIHVFSRNKETGEPAYVTRYQNNTSGLTGMTQPGNLIQSPPDGHYLYVSSSRDSSVFAFERNETTGNLTLVESYRQGQNGVDGINAINSMMVSYDGKNIYVSCSKKNSLAVFERNLASGKLSFIEKQESGVAGVSDMTAPRYAIGDTDGKNIYVANYTGNSIVSFNRNASTGTLSFNTVIKEGITGNAGLINPTIIATDKDGKNAYVASIFQPSLSVFTRNPSTGELVFQQLIQDGVNGISLRKTGAILVSPDGKYLYATDYSNFSILVFDRDLSTGKLTFKQILQEGINDILIVGAGAKLALSDDGKFLYSTGPDGIVYFQRDPATGLLGESNLYSAPPFYPSSLAISQDGGFIYTASTSDSSIHVFSRNVTTGEPVYITKYRNNTDGLTGMTLPNNLLVSPSNDRHLYVSSNRDKSIFLFERNVTTGLLSLVDVFRNGEKGIKNMSAITSMQFDNLGKNLYISCSVDSSILVFNRNSQNGRLLYAGRFAQSGVSGIAGCRSSVVSPDGNFLYTAGHSKNAVGIFKVLSTPTVPDNLVAQGDETNIKLEWNTNPEGNLTSYAIYRNTGDDYTTATLLTSVAASENSYLDETVIKDIIYYYWVKAINQQGNESGYSLPDTAIVNSGITTGIIEKQLQEITLYPNPSSGILNIGQNNLGEVKVEIYDALGIKLKETSVKEITNSLDITSLSEGVYYVKLYNDNTGIVRKIIRK